MLDITVLAKDDNFPAAFDTPSLKSAFIADKSGA
jgi:hypothetical protein